MAAPSEACPSCGAPTGDGQDYCLDCGARLSPAVPVSPVGRAWRRRFGRYPGDWLLASLLLALVAAGSAAAGIVARRNSPGETIRTIVATSPVVTAPVAPPALGRPKPSTPKPAKKPGTQTTASAATASGALAGWPSRNGYTVVLASIPATKTGLQGARAKAKDALQAGLKSVGVLVSARFASLHPGYYVVFAGVYDSLEEAQTAAARVHGRYPNAYARQITR